MHGQTAGLILQNALRRVWQIGLLEAEPLGSYAWLIPERVQDAGLVEIEEIIPNGFHIRLLRYWRQC